MIHINMNITLGPWAMHAEGFLLPADFLAGMKIINSARQDLL